jgi:hypothetical protein
MKGKNLIPREYNGIIIHQRQDDGLINATAMCRAFNKEMFDWLRLDSTVELIEALARRLKLDAISIPVKNRDSANTMAYKKYPSLIKIRRGAPETGGGTWIHYKLGIPLAQWLSAEFALTVSDWVEEWLLTGVNPIRADDLERIAVRRQLKDQDRTYLTDQITAYLQKEGKYSSTNPHFLFSQIHDAINRVLTGETSKQMYQRTGLKSHELLRGYFPLDKLNRYSALSICIANYIMDGHKPLEAVQLAVNQALPRPYQAEPIDPVDPIKKLEQQLLKMLLPPQKH